MTETRRLRRTRVGLSEGAVARLLGVTTYLFQKIERETPAVEPGDPPHYGNVKLERLYRAMDELFVAAEELRRVWDPKPVL